MWCSEGLLGFFLSAPRRGHVAAQRCGFPGRIAFEVAFEEDSRMIIGENGADRLNGKGDLRFRDSAGLRRRQCTYISDEDFEKSCAPVAAGGQF